MKHFRPHLFVAFALTTVLLSGWHSTLRNTLADLRFGWEQRQASGEIVVIAIDASSIEQIGIWPWPRRLHAELLGQLRTAGVSDIAFDVDFSAPSDPASDRQFVEALREAGGSTVLPLFKQPAADVNDAAAVHINRPLPSFAEHSWSAVVNVTVEPDGLVRRYPFGEKLGGEFFPSMGAVLAGRHSEHGAAFLIDFGINLSSIPQVCYVDVLRGDTATLNRLKGKKVIIGSTALELGDRFSVPNGGLVSGPMLQALAAESILQNRALHATSKLVTLPGLLIIALIMMVSWRRVPAGMRVVLLAGMAAAIETFAVLLQSSVPLVPDTSLLHITIAMYLVAIALDEIDLRGLLGRIAESRFHRIAMSLGDGLVCTDQNRLITVWNPGATAIFGYDPIEVIGKPFDLLCAGNFGDASRWFSGPENVQPARLPASRVTEFEGRRKNGEIFPVEACFSNWQGTSGFQHGAILRDISVRKQEAERVRYLAEYDSLTGLANRYTLHARLVDMIWTAESRAGEVALLVIGLDGFQQINDLLGHANGDLVLRAVSAQLRAELGTAAGTAARLSGDEFALAMPRDPHGETVAEFAERVALAFDTPLHAGTRQHRVRVSVGVAVYPEGGRTADELLSNSHLAFCRAKAVRRGRSVVFDSSIRKEFEARLTLEAELALAVERQEFELFYQPQVRLVDGSLTGAEALIRWRHPDRGLVAPGEFIPTVNALAISEPIATWVLETACRQARQWELAGHSIRLSINLSPSQLRQGDLANSVAETLAATGLTPSLLELEVTEDILLLDEKGVLDKFLKIQQLGVRIVFDDFGTGYASLSYLKKFPLDGLKIDRSFVLNLLEGSEDAAIVGSTISLCKQLGLSVIAEGIESRASVDLLIGMGCEQGQGYFFGRPMPVQAFESQFMIARDVTTAIPEAAA